MRKLATAAAVSLSLVTVPGSIHAVGLGEIEMYSTLNQPLDAEVGLLDAKRLELLDLVVKGTPVGSFSDGATPPALSSMRFNVIQRPDGTPAIKITSDAPVIEPFLNFMLSVDTASGERVVREYTVLLDPPVFGGLAQTDLDDELLPTGNSVETDGSAVIRRQPVASIPEQGVAVDLSDEIVPQGTAQLPDLRQAERVDVTMADVTGLEQPAAQPSRQYDSIETSTTINSEAPGDEEVSLTEAEEIPLTPEMMAQGFDELAPAPAPEVDDSDKPYQEIALTPELVAADTPVPQLDYQDVDLSELAIARDDRWYEKSEELDLLEPIARDDSWYASAVEIELLPEMFGLDPAPSSSDLGPVASVAPKPASTAQQRPLSAYEPEPLDYSKDGVPVPLEELAASIGRRVIGNYDSEVFLFEKSRVPLRATEIPAVAVDGDLAEAAVAAGDEQPLENEFEFDTSDSDADGGEPVGERIDLDKELPAFEARKKAQAAAANTYRVRGRDTLWSIAEQNRGAGVSTQQMMVALLQANRDAFIDSDMNRLRNGAILRIPEQASVASIDRAEALQMVRQQMSLWQKYRGTTPVTSVSRPLVEDAQDAVEADQPAVAEREPAGDEQADEQIVAEAQDSAEQPQQPEPVALDRLSIVGVDGSTQDAENAGLADGAGAPETEQTSAAEQLAAEQAIAEQLAAEEEQAREQELAAIEAAKQRLLTLQQEQLAALQEQSSDADASVVDEVETAPAGLQGVEADQSADDDSAAAETDAVAESSQPQEAADSEAVRQGLEALAAESDARENALVADAQARSERLAGEADAIAAQLLALQSEKKALQDAGDADKAALVADAEREKARLLDGAKAEQARIAAELEQQRQQVRDELQRRQQELRANGGAEMVVDSDDTSEPTLAAGSTSDGDSDNAIESAESVETQPVATQGDADAQPDSDDGGDAVGAPEVPQVESADTDAEGTIRLVDDSETAATAIVDASAEPAADAPAASGIAATLQKALGDRQTLLGAGAGLAVLGLLGALLLRRKPKPEKSIAERVEPGFAPRAADPLDDIETNDGPADPSVSSGAEAGAKKVAEVTEDMDETLVRDDTVSEADVYLAYGLYGQAEDLLTAAIDRSPDDAQFQMKLIETHFVQRDREKFQAAAARFQDRFDDAEARDRIDQMTSELESAVEAEQSSSEPSGVISALAAVGQTAQADVPPVVQNALDSEAAGETSAPELAAPQPEPAPPSEAGVDDSLHGLEALLGDKPEPDDSELARIAADESQQAEDLLDQTIDPGAEFELSELEATGDFGAVSEAVAKEAADAETPLGDATLDEVDFAALDDDGTLNLDGVAGDTMSDVDLSNMDLTQQGLDATLDNLTLDDADLDLVGSADVTAAADAGATADGEGSDMSTMLDLAKAYLDMGDNDSAIGALREIAEGGTPAQREEAAALLKNIG